MSLPYDLLKCTTCKKADKTTASVSTTKIFHPLFDVHCTSCNSTWLACLEHNIRWERRRFYKAISHLESVSHSTTFLNQRFDNDIDYQVNHDNVFSDQAIILTVIAFHCRRKPMNLFIHKMILL